MKLLLGLLAGCQPSLSGYRGSLYSPSFPYYGNYENCYWSITVPRGYRVELYFNTFETQSGRDYLYIYDGPSSGSPMLASLSGYRNGYRYYSSGPSLSFRWYTDGSGTRRGFAASYWAIYGEYSSLVAIPNCRFSDNYKVLFYDKAAMQGPSFAMTTL